MHFLTLGDFTQKELQGLIDHALTLKRDPASAHDALRGKTVALIFLKHSTRTRVSFEVGVHQLGGNSTYLSPDTTQLGRGETIGDTVVTLSRYVDGIVARLYEYEQLTEMARHATVPIINGLTNFNHPCQILGDLMTVLEHKSRLAGLRIAFLGAADNNIVNSLLHACPRFGISLTVCAPPGQALNKTALREATRIALDTGAEITLTHDPKEAVRAADVLYTDVWFSMHEEPSEEGRRMYAPYQVNRELMEMAPTDAVFMHCMPVHRGWEATDEVVDSPQSIIFDQAENRLHIQKAIMLKLMA